MELIEIDENLCRSDLTSAQRSASVKRRKEVWEALHPAEQQVENTGASCASIPKRGRGQPQAFAAETAALTGESKKSINRHLARAEALGDDIREVVGTSLDKGVELDALKGLPEAQRWDALALGRKAKTKPSGFRWPMAGGRLPMAGCPLQVDKGGFGFALINLIRDLNKWAVRFALQGASGRW